MPEESKSSGTRTPNRSLSEYIPFGKDSVSASRNNSEFTRGSNKRLQNGSLIRDGSRSNLAKAKSIKKDEWHKIGIVRLHEEIVAFHESMMPSPEDQIAREDVVNRITAAVKSLWKTAKLEVFGSFRTGLYLPTSDVDLVIFGGWNVKPLHTLKDELVRREIAEEERINVLDKASVPIIKLTDKTTGIKVDIAFNITNGLTSAEMIQSFVKEFPSLPYLILILKQFVYQRDLNEVYTGGIGSYSLILLIVSYLQLQARAEGRKTGVNYGVQLIEFFELYGLNFNYSRTGISVADGGKYVKKDEDSREQMSLYIQDPVSADNDVARGTYNISVIQAAFNHAYFALCHEITRPHLDITSTDQPLLSCIIDIECQSDSPDVQLNDSADDSLNFVTSKRLSFADNSAYETPEKANMSASTESVKKSKKKRKHDESALDLDGDKKRKKRNDKIKSGFQTSTRDY